MEPDGRSRRGTGLDRIPGGNGGRHADTGDERAFAAFAAGLSGTGNGAGRDDERPPCAQAVRICAAGAVPGIFPGRPSSFGDWEIHLDGGGKPDGGRPVRQLFAGGPCGGPSGFAGPAGRGGPRDAPCRADASGGGDGRRGDPCGSGDSGDCGSRGERGDLRGDPDDSSGNPGRRRGGDIPSDSGAGGRFQQPRPDLDLSGRGGGGGGRNSSV